MNDDMNRIVRLGLVATVLIFGISLVAAEPATSELPRQPREKDVLYGQLTWAPPQPRIRDPRIPRDEGLVPEISATQLVWFRTDEPLFPVQAKRLVEAWVNEGCIDVKKCGTTSSYSLVDLDGDRHSEIIVRSDEFSSGGTEHLILKRTEGKWASIGRFQGGFVLQIDEAKPNRYRIVAYSRSGATYQSVYEYKAGRYHLVSLQQLPAVVTGMPHWEKLWQQLNGYIE